MEKDRGRYHISLNKPVRIAQVMGKMMSGGVESAVMNYYRHIDHNKVQFDFIIDEDSTIVPYDEINKLGGSIFTVPPYQRPIAYHKTLVKLFREQQWKMVHSHINTLSVFPLFAAKRAGVPIRIAHNHSTAGKGEYLRNIMKYALRLFSKIFPTHYCACSEHAGRWLFGNKHFDSGRVMLLKNAIDTSKFMFDPAVREAVRKELGLENRFVIGHAGRFMKQKNHSFLIDIFKQAHRQRPDAVLLLVGEGELEGEIKRKVTELGLHDCVRFMGVRNDVNRLLQAMDVFLFPSLYEGLGIAAVEAQVSGLSVVASDAVPQETKLTNNFTYIPLNKSAGKWADAVVNCGISNRKSNARVLFDTGYDIETAAKYLEDMYFKYLKELRELI